jgi:hypothetical protein
MATLHPRTVPDSPTRPFMTRPHIMRVRGVWLIYWVPRIPTAMVLEAARWTMATLGGPTAVHLGDPF